MSWADGTERRSTPVNVASVCPGADQRPAGGSEHEVETRTGTDPDRACHDVLLAMAGRLPDRLLWRLRDWLSCGAPVALRTALPRALLRHRVGVTEDERATLRAAVSAWGGSPRLVDAVLHVDATPAPAVCFLAPSDGPGWDDTDLVLRAVAPLAGGVVAVRRAWRAESGGPVRVVLVEAHGDLPALTGALQRTLRAGGEADPQVEVLSPGDGGTGYHRDALAVAATLWRSGGAASVSGAAPVCPERPAAPARADTGELVGHG